MVERIKIVIKESGLSNGDFADKIGVNPASLSHILSGRNKPSLDFVMKLLDAFGSINTDWLLFGKETENDIQKESESKTKTLIEDEDQGVYEVKSIKNTPEDSTTLVDEIPERIIFFFRDGRFKQYKP